MSKRKETIKQSIEDDDDDFFRRSVTPLAFSRTPQKISSSPDAINGIRQRQTRNFFKQESFNNSNFLQTLSEDESEMNSIFSSVQDQKPSTVLSKSLPVNSGTPSKSFNGSRPMTPATVSRPMTPAMRRVLSEIAPQEPARNATPFMHGMSGRIQCQGLTAKGLQCKNAAVIGTTKCRIHSSK